MTASMLVLYLFCITGILCAPMPSTIEDTLSDLMHRHDPADDESFYRFLYNITDGKMFSVSNYTHEIFKSFKSESPDLDPKEFIPFNCSTSRPHPHHKPTSVHKLTPFDVDIVAALGDSLTAGFGALSFYLVDIFVEYRGVSWSIGGDSVLKKHITLPNIIKRFNPDVKGYSMGITPPLIPMSWEHLNFAVSGDTVYGLIPQAKEFVATLKRNPMYDLNNDWKLVTIFIGGNDLCSCCRRYMGYIETYSPENYIKQMTKVLDYLSDNVPRLFVNIADAPDVTLLHGMNSVQCEFTHFIECKCGTWMGEEARVYTKDAMYKYRELLTDLVVHSGRYDDKDDFAVVVQPFIDATKIPRFKNGTIDPSYWAPDCFHFSGKAHSAAAHGLWNNMLQPVGHKDKMWKQGEPYKCPTDQHPYFYTKFNSKKKHTTR